MRRLIAARLKVCSDWAQGILAISRADEQAESKFSPRTLALRFRILHLADFISN